MKQPVQETDCPDPLLAGNPDPLLAGNQAAGDQTALLRTFDAAANRAAEGLRVVEDYVRFVLDDRHLTEVAKGLRHDLTAALEPVPPAARHAVRDTRSDVGTTLTTKAEQSRRSAWDVCLASFSRSQQALRSLEEFGKALQPDAIQSNMGQTFEGLRYRAYSLERAVDVTLASCQRLETALLYVLVSGGESPDEFDGLIRSVIGGGADVIQLRDKSLSDRQLVERARQLRELTRDTKTLAIINDRPDIARLSHADGVHVGQDELSVKDARTIVGPHALIGVSTHSIEQARSAVLDGANYIGIGPTFPSDTKAFEAYPGTDFVRDAAAEIRLPTFAIGGISAGNIRQVLRAGGTRVTVGSAITGSSDPAQATAALRERLSKGNVHDLRS